MVWNASARWCAGKAARMDDNKEFAIGTCVGNTEPFPVRFTAVVESTPRIKRTKKVGWRTLMFPSFSPTSPPPPPDPDLLQSIFILL